MNNLISLRPFANLAILLLVPAVAHAHPGHGAADGFQHDLAHFGLGVAALLFTLGLGLAAKKLSARHRARVAGRHARRNDSAVKRSVSETAQ